MGKAYAAEKQAFDLDFMYWKVDGLWLKGEVISVPIVPPNCKSNESFQNDYQTIPPPSVCGWQTESPAPNFPIGRIN